ncbi:MAG: hypothetical protein AAF581_10095 [Planctomycetota bacterium]
MRRFGLTVALLLFFTPTTWGQGSITPIGGGGVNPAPFVPIPTGPMEAPFRELDNITGSWINFNHAPVRPFVFMNDFNDIYAVNTHDSTVVHFRNSGPKPVATHRVPWSPVSIALWKQTTPTTAMRLLVVCRGNYSLVIMGLDGVIHGLVPLNGEPADVVVVGDHAYVSCPGIDQVAKVDLLAETVALNFTVASKQPFFLTRWRDDVVVTPMLSGNNTVVEKGNGSAARAAGDAGILDLAGNPAGSRLPDNDLFLCSSTATATSGNTVAATPLATGIGTTLFGHDIQPGSGDELWVLNTDANNTGKLGNNLAPGVMSEPAIRGLVAVNQLTRVNLTTGTVLPPIPLDQPGTTTALNTNRTVGQPFDVAFVPSGPRRGTALIVGLLNNRVTVLRPDGSYFFNFQLQGTLPRAVAYDHTRTRAIVYCWGTNTIEIYSFGPINLEATLDLGYDPTPALIAAGREVFYDGSHSQFNNASCATCHIEGGMDHEEWDLSCEPVDNKGPLITQTLFGIDRLLPFHWRGERFNGLIDFNDAFPGLLGGAELDVNNGEFDAFEAFVLSLQSPANPFEHPRRILVERSGPELPTHLPNNLKNATIGDPINGQNLWFDHDSVGDESCNSCHLLPTATNGDVITDGSNSHPKRRRLMITGFNAMWRKVQDNVLVDIGGTDFRYPITGGGFAHSGASTNLIEFTTGGRFDNNPQDTSDVAAFMHQVDTGIAPAVHASMLFDMDHYVRARNYIQNYMIPQAQAGNCDLVAFGTSTFGSTTATVRWVYNQATQQFASEFSFLGERPFSFFDSQVQSGDGVNIFVGMPLGMGRRFGIDFDNDGLPNIDETRAFGTNPLVADSDLDGFEDGHEVDNGSNPKNGNSTPTDTTDPTIADLTLDWIGTRQAKLSWTTSEPTSFSITYTGVDKAGTTLPSETASDAAFKTHHSVLLNGLIGATKIVNFDRNNPVFLEQVVYDGTLTVTDRGNRTAQAAIPTLNPAPFTREPGNNVAAIVTDLQWTQTPDLASSPSGTVTGTASATLFSKLEQPNSPSLAGVVVVARVMIQRPTDFVPVVDDSFTAALRYDSFTTGGQNNMNPPPVHLPGPYLMSTESDASGLVTFDFSVPIEAGDKIILNLEAAGPAPAGYPTAGPPHLGGVARWAMPDTEADNRKLEAMP